VNTFFSIVGIVTFTLGGIGLLLCAGSALMDQVQHLHNCMKWDAEAHGRRDAGAMLVREAYWYSEDEAVMAALEIIGRRMVENRGGFIEISSCRDEWRNRKGKSR
jgi:hypothetical protein